MVLWLICAGIFTVAFLCLGYWLLLESMFPEQLRTREVTMLTTQDLWKLRVCRYRKGRAPGEPVLLVHGAMANHHNFTCPPGGCLIDYLMERGYDCWAFDLRGCRSSEAPFERSLEEITMDDYLLFDIPAVLEHIRKTTGYAKVHWVGHSLGGMLLYAHAQLTGGAHIASGTTLGSPIGFDGVTRREPENLAKLLHYGHGFFGTLMRAGIPIALLIGRAGHLMPVNLKNRAKGLGARHFFNMIDRPIPKLVHGLAVMSNTKIWKMNSGQLDVKAGLSTMRVPLLAIYATRDPFVTIESAKAFFEALPTQDKRLLICGKEHGCKHDYDHCDLAFGEAGAKEVFEPIAEWIAEHPITEHVQVEGESGAPVIVPMASHERVGILSGDSYAHVHAPVIAVADTQEAERAHAQELAPQAEVEVEIEAIAVNLDDTVESALDALEAKLSKSLKSEAKPQRSQRIRNAASSLESIAQRIRLEDGDGAAQASKAKPAVKAKAKAKSVAPPAKKPVAKAKPKAKAPAKPAAQKPKPKATAKSKR